MIVMQYSSEGSLREFLNKHYAGLTLYEKFSILKNIACGLKDLHKESRLHQNLHPGNIIMIEKTTPNLTDFGICKPIELYKSSDENIYGVLPYVAPELLTVPKYSYDTDIYSFGIIMYEVLTGLPPYHDVSHDGALALKIVEGERPEIKEKSRFPSSLLGIMENCWDKDPDKRPTAQEVFHELYRMVESFHEQDSSFYKEVQSITDAGESSNGDNNKPLEYTVHACASYTSKLLDFEDLPKPDYKNNQGILSIFIYFKVYIQILFSFYFVLFSKN